MIPSSNIAAMGISMAIAVLFPIILLIYFYRKHKISFKAVGIGAATFIVFVTVEKLLQVPIFRPGSLFMENTILFSVTASLMAGIFEETGRYIAFTYILKKHRRWKDGIAYGIGHGGIESVVIGGLSFFGLMITAIMFNKGQMPGMEGLPPDAAQQLNELKQSMITSGWYMYLLGGIERIMAVVTHIGFTMVVLYGVRNRKPLFLLYAILLHAGMDMFAALFQKGILNVWVVEGLVLVLAVTTVILIRRTKRFFPEQPEGESMQPPSEVNGQVLDS
jgi:uncharacterized membrane protein YhfC